MRVTETTVPVPPAFAAELDALLRAPKPAPERRGFTLHEAARHLGLSEQTAYRRLRAMVADGRLRPEKERVANAWGDVKLTSVYVPVSG